LRALQIWEVETENSCGYKLLILQTDNAGEFIGKLWTKVCQNEGIIHYTTAPYRPSSRSKGRILSTSSQGLSIPDK